MNRNNSVVLAVTAMALLALCPSSNAQPDPEEWDVEWWSGETETNPYTNAAGVVWGIYWGSSAVGMTDWSTYTAMEWFEAENRWAAPNAVLLPRFVAHRAGIDTRRMAPAALTFDPPANFKASGRFSLYGAPVLRVEYTELYIGILDGSDNFTELHHVAVTVNNTHALDLGPVEALQNLRLRAGERIVFITRRSEYHATATTRVQFNPTDLSGATVGIRWDYVAPQGTVFIAK